MKQIPRFQSHARVRAFKIKSITREMSGDVVLGPTDPDLSAVIVTESWLRTYGAQVGGYYVLHEDSGMATFMPARAFEGSYTQLFNVPWET